MGAWYRRSRRAQRARRGVRVERRWRAGRVGRLCDPQPGRQSVCERNGDCIRIDAGAFAGRPDAVARLGSQCRTGSGVTDSGTEVAESVVDPTRTDLRRRFLSSRTLVSFAVAGVLLALTWILADLRLEDIVTRIRSADPWLILLAYLIFAVTFPIRTLRWRILLTNAVHREDVSPDYRMRDLAQILYISWFVNGVVPAKLGDIYRAYMARANYGTSLTRTLGTIFSERVFDVGALIIMVMASAAWIARSPETSEDVGRILAIAALALAILALGVLFLLVFGTPIFARLPQVAAAVYAR
ncbi:MAG: flippase-like domain-containing protein [Chloroflexi bacterium]|nr:flippase-like domain-containing protein [Chloroflexota bacterium]